MCVCVCVGGGVTNQGLVPLWRPIGKAGKNVAKTKQKNKNKQQQQKNNNTRGPRFYFKNRKSDYNSLPVHKW